MSYSYFADFYDILTSNVEYARRADYICSLLSENGIDRGLLLDLACGTGSMSVELAKKGFQVTGVDLSSDMLCVAQNKACENGLDIMFLCQDMRNIDLYGTVDCAICCLDSINHLTSESDVEATFRRVSLFLNDGGIFVFDVNTLYKHRYVLGNNAFTYDCDGVFCAWQNTLKPDNETVQIDLDFFVNDADDCYTRFSESFCEKAYEPGFIKSALEKSDFTLVGEYNELTKDAPDEQTQRIVFVARRNDR